MSNLFEEYFSSEKSQQSLPGDYCVGDDCGTRVTKHLNKLFQEEGIESDKYLPSNNLGVGIPGHISSKFGVPLLGKGKLTPDALKALGPGTAIAYTRPETHPDRKYGATHAEVTEINPETGELMVASKSANKGILWKPISQEYINRLPENAKASNPWYNRALETVGNVLGPSSAEAATPKNIFEEKLGSAQTENIFEERLRPSLGSKIVEALGQMATGQEQDPMAVFGMQESAPELPGFQKAYKDISQKLKIDSNPDNPEHFYDYRGAYQKYGPDFGVKDGHFPSEFKQEGHPNLIVDGVDTRKTKGAPPQIDLTNEATMTDTLADNAMHTGEFVGEALDIPFVPLRWVVGQAGQKVLRPAMEAAFPRATKEELDLAQHGIEFVAELGILPSYFSAIGKGLGWLTEVGRMSMYRHAPQWFFKPGAKIDLPAVIPPTPAQMARANKAFKEQMIKERMVGEAGWTKEAAEEAIKATMPEAPVPSAVMRTTPTPAAGAAMGERMGVAPREVEGKALEINEVKRLLEEKGWHGTVDRLNRGLITEEQARAELTGDLSHIKPPTIEPIDPYDFASQMKRQGIKKQESWSRWVQKTSLNPGMDAKDWYKIYDSVSEGRRAAEVVPEAPKPSPKEDIYYDGHAKDIIRKELITKKGGKEIGITAAKMFGTNPSIVKEATERLEYYNQPDLKNDADFNGVRTRLKAFIATSKKMSLTPEEVSKYSEPPPAAPEAVEGKAKEPWEMTYKELRDELQPKTKDDIKRIEGTLRNLYPEYTESKTPDTRNDFAYGIWRMANRQDELSRMPFVDLSQRHKTSIAKALAAGKPVPPEVLADYPDLAGKAKPAEQLAEEGLPEVAESPGAQYTGFVQDVFDPAAVARAAEEKPEPITRESILTPLMKHFKMPLYQGRVKGKKTAGFFRKKIGEVRVKKMSDIETTAHEVAHLLDRNEPEVGRLYKQRGLRDEVRSVSYDQKKLYEGFAEFVRHWMTQPEVAQQKAPRFYEAWENYLNTSPHGEALRQAQKGMTDWFAQDALTRSMSKQGAQEDINSFLQESTSTFRQTVLDDLQGVKSAEQFLSGDIANEGMYVTSRNTRGLGGLIEGAVKFGAPRVIAKGRTAFVDKNGNPSVIYKEKADGTVEFIKNPNYEPWGLEKILEPVVDDLQNWGAYAVGRRAQYLKGQNRENLFSNAEIQAMLSLETPVFKKVFEDYQRFNKQLLDYCEAAGIINRETRPLWETNVYIPFYRAIENIGTGGKGKGIFRPIRRLFGGTANIANPIENIFKNMQVLMKSAVYNEARTDIVDSIMANKNGARFLTKIPKDVKAVHVDKEQVRKKFLEAVEGEIDETSLAAIEANFDDMEPFLRFWLYGQQPRSDNVIAIMKNGNPEYYEVADPILLRALQALPRKFATYPFKNLFTLPFRVIRGTITSSPTFWARNVFRDQFMAGTLSKHGYLPFVNATKGMMSRITKDPVYQEYLANGGGMASIYNETSEINDKLKRFYEKHGILYNTVINTPRKLYQALDTIGNTFEIATRLGEMKNAVARGETPMKGAFDAREISTDFAMRGDSSILGFLYDTVPFLKAGVVSVDRVYRGFRDKDTRLNTALKTGAIALVSGLLYLYNRNHPDYERLENWDKDTHWHIYIPNTSGKEDWHFRLPKPWEIGAVGSITERALEGVLNAAPVEFAKNSARIVREMFRWDVLPGAIAPIYEQMANRLSFFDRPIETQSMQSLEPWARSSPYGSRTLRFVGEQGIRHLPRSMQMSPARLEALLKGYFTAWAGIGLNIADALFFDDIPNMRADDYPVIRAFYRQDPARHTKYEKEFYDMLRATTEARRTMNEMKKRYNNDIAEDIEYTTENMEYKRLSKANRNLQEMSKDMKDIVYAQSFDDLTKITDKMKKYPIYQEKFNKIPNSSFKDIKALKRDMLDVITDARNYYIEKVVKGEL